MLRRITARSKPLQHGGNLPSSIAQHLLNLPFTCFSGWREWSVIWKVNFRYSFESDYCFYTVFYSSSVIRAIGDRFNPLERVLSITNHFLMYLEPELFNLFMPVAKYTLSRNCFVLAYTKTLETILSSVAIVSEFKPTRLPSVQATVFIVNHT